MEKLLHYIWKHRILPLSELRIVCNDHCADELTDRLVMDMP